MGDVSKDLKKPWVHFIAIGGTGMGAVAALMQQKGFFVTGSDGPLYPPMSYFLRDRAIPLSDKYDAANLEGSKWGLAPGTYPKIVVIGNAISRGHVEADKAEELASLKLSKKLSFPEALAEFCIEDRKSFVVAGTHGKTTTTSLMAWALECLGLKPGFLIGGIPINFNEGCRATETNLFVSEGDEYDTAYWDKESKFLHYRPSWVLCTGIEFDHADIFSKLEAIEISFLKLVSKTSQGWLLIDAKSAPKAESVEKVAREVISQKKRLLRYGWAQDSDFQLIEEKPGPLSFEKNLWGSHIKFKVPGGKIWKVESPLSGVHNALNILGVIGTLFSSGELKSETQAQEFLKTFKGIKRRQEELFSSAKLVVIDDFAHHPTAIRETISAIKGRYPNSKVAAFFEPRSATSARNVLAKEMAACFDEADAIFLTPPTKTNIPTAEKLNIESLKSDISGRAKNKEKHLLVNANIDELAGDFKNWAGSQKERVVALVMSNGPFGGIHTKLFSGEKR